MTKNRLIATMNKANNSDTPVMIKVVNVDDEGMIHEIQLNIQDIQMNNDVIQIICDR